MRRVALLGSLMGLAAVLAVAQQPTGRIEGRVLNAVTGEPVRGVSVNLIAAPPGTARRTEVSDSDGRFTFENLEPGAYGVWAGPLVGRSGPVVTVRAGETVRDIVLRMPARGSISGRVIDKEERPVAKVWVTCRDSRIGPLATTGADGGFRIQGLPSGNCVLMAVPVGVQPETSEERLVVTYYPSTTEEAAAIPLLVSPGQELSGITIVLRKGRLYSVQGSVVVASPSLSPADIRVFLMPRSRGELMAGALLKREDGGGVSLAPDGSFDVGRVPPGSYYLRAERRGDTRLVLGRMNVEIRGEDLKGLVLVARDPLHLTGTFRTEDDDELDLSKVGIMLTSVDGVQPPWASSTLNAENVFEMWDLPADDYVVKVSDLPQGTYVKSIRVGGRETTDLRMDLSAMEVVPSVEVLVSPKGATVEGTVKDDKKPVSGVWVRLVADPERPGSSQRTKAGITDLKGRFRLSGVAPGEYRVYAIEDVQALGDPGLSSAMKLSVAEGERKQVEVTLSRPGGAR